MKNVEWWSPKAGFFGNFYVNGDNSKKGYLINNDQTLGERTLTEVNGVEKLLSLQPNAKILDCPCGYGRHSIALAEKGYHVTASDINPIHLNIMSTNISAFHNRKISDRILFNISDMRYLQVSTEFDAVINMFYSFGFFETDVENELVLRNFWKSLRPGGKFLMHTDVNLPRVLSGNYKTDEFRNLNSKNTLRIIDNYNPKTKRMNGEWIINGVSKQYSVRVYSKSEFIRICLKVGFTSCVAYSNWQGNDYTEASEDMIIVATK
ncbi:MAG: SAM-dependent methyltransferase [Candidatus Moraniibacteriota bacterium]|jgi:cyclopropane fatty-acyl-phospholipid synthase-like methyltransferase